MKSIVIKRLSLLNFKGIRNLTVDFDEYETSVFGANGTGKTTLFDAFTWVLFGKDSSDRKEFNIKTLDKDNRAIERIPHEVAACIEVNGEEINLKKCYHLSLKLSSYAFIYSFIFHAQIYITSLFLKTQDTNVKRNSPFP